MQSRLKIFLSSICLMVFLAAVPVTASAQRHGHSRGAHRGVRGNTVIVYPYDYGWGYGWGWDPYWDWGTPYGPYGFYQQNTGTVKLKDVDKHDQVYLNGSYAGEADKLKSMDLPPGSYSVQVKHNGADVVNQQVYVTTGKTVKLEVGDKPAH